MEADGARYIAPLSDHNGHLSVIWENEGNIYFRRFDTELQSWSTIQNISLPYKKARTPVMAMDRNGDLHAVWEESRQIFYRKYSAFSQMWSTEIINISGEEIGQNNELEILYDKLNKKQFVMVNSDVINIHGKLPEGGSGDDVLLKLAGTQYTTKANKDREYLFKDIPLQEGDNAYSVVAKVPADMILLKSGFITYQVPKAQTPLIAVGHQGVLHVVWVDGEKLVYKYFRDGQWRQEVYAIASKTMNWLGSASMAVDFNGDVYFTWVDESKVYWRQYSVKRNELTPVSTVSTAKHLGFNPKCLYTSSDTLNVFKPISGFSFAWLEKKPGRKDYDVEFFDQSLYVPLPPAPVNVSAREAVRKHLQIRWNPYRGQAGYQVIISKTPEFTPPFFYDSGPQITEESFHTVAIPLDNELYYYQVRMSSETWSWGPFSAPQSYTAADVEIPVPLLNAVERFNNKQRIKLSWDVVGEASQDRMFLPNRFN